MNFRYSWENQGIQEPGKRNPSKSACVLNLQSPVVYLLLAFYSFFSINFVVHDDVSCLCEKNLNLGILFGKENCQIYQNFSQETHIYWWRHIDLSTENLNINSGL